jgi:two-component system, NtrC family, sensor kinase
MRSKETKIMSSDGIQNLKLKASGHILIYIIFINVFFLLASALSVYFNTRNVDRQYKELATVIGRSIFREFLIIRKWNAEHGGVYVPVTDRFQPNPYLEDVRRDVITTDGEKLTKINPEYMTRLLSEILQKENGIRIHITSLKLMSPANQADQWEEKTLEKFEQGSEEENGIVGSQESPTFRYMAPLKTEETCITCHAKQGYRVGDIRGGLSVSFPYLPIQKAVNAAKTRIYGVHIAFFIIGVAIVSLLGKKLINKIEELQKALRHIKSLEGLLPICAHCKMIRKEGADPRDQASWLPMETYIEERTDAQFTHGICPACIKQHYGFQLDEEV